MIFEPKTEEQLKAESLLPEGDYDFEVIAAEEQTSKKNNAMIALKLQVWGKDGSTRHVYDYLLEAMMFKLLHFCESVGLQKEYQEGRIDAGICLRKAGRVRIFVQAGKNGYSDKNAVDDYIVPEGGKKMERAKGKAKKEPQPVTEDDVPF